jgi:hypothetical protein
VDAEPEYVSLTRRAFPGLNALFDAGEDVRQLMTHPGWAHVTGLIDLALADADAVLDGRLLDSRADYARAHGRRHGLRSMQQAAHAIVSESDRKLAEQRKKYEGAAEPALNGGSR